MDGVKLEFMQQSSQIKDKRNGSFVENYNCLGFQSFLFHKRWKARAFAFEKRMRPQKFSPGIRMWGFMIYIQLGSAELSLI